MMQVRRVDMEQFEVSYNGDKWMVRRDDDGNLIAETADRYYNHTIIAGTFEKLKQEIRCHYNN